MNRNETVLSFVMTGCFLLGALSLARPSQAQADSSQKPCLAPAVKAVDDSKMRAVQFMKLESYSTKQRRLLEGFLGQTLSQEVLDSFQTAHNDQAATFLAVTHALAGAELDLGNGNPVAAIDLIDQISEIRGVRFIATVNLSYFAKWNQAGSKYVLNLSEGKSEVGAVTFADHWQMGGGLHCGYDTQGFTHYHKPPYIHWNVNQSTGSSDIHLDGREPWILGIIPNFEHLMYGNSDVRQWFRNYLKKYGDPGFTVQK